MNAQEIKQLRITMGMTQQEFCHALGIAHSTLCHWESGRKEPSKMARKILEQQREAVSLRI
jgi:DNA-binding transcriptional regulator YiaG